MKMWLVQGAGARYVKGCGVRARGACEGCGVQVKGAGHGCGVRVKGAGCGCGAGAGCV